MDGGVLGLRFSPQPVHLSAKLMSVGRASLYPEFGIPTFTTYLGIGSLMASIKSGGLL